MNDEAKQPFMSHLEELRKRLINCIIAIGVAFAATYAFAEEIFNFLTAPLRNLLPEGEKMIYTNPPELFFTYLKTALITGILLASPYVFYQGWKFIAPGLYQNEKKYIIPFVFASTVLFIGGTVFGYLMIFPFGFSFFLGIGDESFRALIKVNEYFTFSSKLLLAFGLGFELPVILFFLTKIGVVSIDFLKKNRKYALLLAFIAAAIFTPPDPVTQCMMAVPLVLLYEAGIFFARFAGKKKKEEEEE